MGSCTGFSVPVAKYFGAGKLDKMRDYIFNGAALAVLIAAILTTLCSLLCAPILHLLSVPSDIFADAYAYQLVIFLGIPFSILYNYLSSILRAVGDSRTPFLFLAFSAILNIFLDLFCIIILHLGCAGAAIATISAQAISGLLCLFFISRRVKLLLPTKENRTLRKDAAQELLAMGIPTGLQFSITAIGSVVLQTGINTLGSAAVASVSAASKLSMFLACPFDAIGSAMATYTGQNVGAGKIERIGQGLKASVLIGITYSILIFLVMLFSAKYWMLLFINASETEIIHNAVLFILANSGFYIALVFVNAVRFTIQGAGFSGLAILAGVMEMIARAIIGVIMVPYLGFASVCFASPLAWIMADCFLIPAYCHVIRKLKQRRAQGVPNM